MTRLLRLLVPLIAFALPLALGTYHSSRNFGAWNNIGVRYNPAWLFVYGAAFVVAAFVFGVPALVHRADQVLLASLLAATTPLAAASIVYVLYDPLVPRLVVVGTPALLFVAFVVLSFLHGLFHGRSAGSDRVAFIIGPHEWAGLENDLRFQPERSFSVATVQEPDAVQSTEEFAELVAGSAPTLLVLSAAAQVSPSIVSHAARMHERGLRVRSLTGFYEEWLGKLPIGELERSSLWFDIRDIHELHYTRIKRVMDLVIAAALTPLLLVSVPVVLVANLVGNQGPLFFRQSRVGQYDSVFSIWKYRTMSVQDAADGAGEWTASDDPRITRVGRLLRVSHVDELPQVINVLLGQLSIVGPRPEQVHYVEELTKKIPFYGLRHVVKPGITGWAQVKYPYGASEHDALEKLQYELFYLKRQSPGLDVRVCARTVRSMLLREGR